MTKRKKCQKGKGIRNHRSGARLEFYVRAGLPEPQFKQRLTVDEGVGHVHTWRKSVLGSGNSKRRGAKTGVPRMFMGWQRGQISREE